MWCFSSVEELLIVQEYVFKLVALGWWFLRVFFTLFFYLSDDLEKKETPCTPVLAPRDDKHSFWNCGGSCAKIQLA